MSRNIFISLLLCSLWGSLPCEGGLFRNLGASPHPWRFDGREFVPGAGDGGVVILVRDGYQPVLRGGGAASPTEPLPAGRGAIAGFCYIQASGGKLAPQGGIIPAGGCRVAIVGADRRVRQVTADQNGYFALSLPPGSYEVRGAGSPLRVDVNEGTTALVPLRTGKRMVD